MPKSLVHIFSSLICFHFVSQVISQSIDLSHFQDCGIALKIYQPTNQYIDDSVTQLLNRRFATLSQKIFPKLIQYDFSQKDVVPKTTRNDHLTSCFIHVVFIQQSSEIYSSIQSFRSKHSNLENIVHYKKATFIFVVPSIFYVKNTHHLNEFRFKQYRIFQAWLTFAGSHRLTYRYYVHQWYFFCSICLHNYQNLRIEYAVNIRRANINDLQRFYDKVLLLQPGSPKTETGPCGSVNRWSIGMLTSSCRSVDIQTESILDAARLSNKTQVQFGLVLPWLRKPKICMTSKDEGLSPMECTSVLQTYFFNPVVYCIHDVKGSMSNNQIWFTPFPVEIWIVLLLCLVIIAAQKTLRDPIPDVTVSRFISTMYANMALALKYLLRQSGSNSYVFLILMEFLVSIILAVYENYVTSVLIVPFEVEGFKNFTELMNHGYTFLHRGYNNSARNLWIQHNFDTNKRKTTENIGNNSIYTVEHYNKYFSKKYAFIDDSFDPTFTISRLKEAVGYKYTCYALTPPEIIFNPYPVFYEFCTILADKLQKSLRQLQEIGWYTLLVKSEKHFTRLLLRRFRVELAAADPIWLEHQRKLHEGTMVSSFISFRNLNSMVQIVSSLFGVSFVLFTIEVIGNIPIGVYFNYIKYKIEASLKEYYRNE